jgi:hypothetical protein
MRTWPRHPVIYEINTWVWLGELSRKHRRPVTLVTVPEQEWDAIASYGFDAVWMSKENPLCGTPRIRGELLMLGIEVAQSTVARYMTRR